MDTYEHITPENGLYSFQITNNTLLKHILPIINTKSDCLSGKEGEMFYVKDIKNCGVADGNPLETHEDQICDTIKYITSNSQQGNDTAAMFQMRSFESSGYNFYSPEDLWVADSFLFFNVSVNTFGINIINTWDHDDYSDISFDQHVSNVIAIKAKLKNVLPEQYVYIISRVDNLESYTFHLDYLTEEEYENNIASPEYNEYEIPTNFILNEEYPFSIYNPDEGAIPPVVNLSVSLNNEIYSVNINEMTPHTITYTTGGLTVINGLLDLTVFGYKNPPRSGICTPTTSSVYVFEEE